MQFSWIPLCTGYKLGMVGIKNNKLPPSVTEIHDQSTLISSGPPVSCHLYPQNQIPMCLWPESHPHCHNHCRGPPRAPVNGRRAAVQTRKTFENSHSSRCGPKDSGVILQGLAGGCEPGAWANQDGQRDPTEAAAGGFGKGTSRGDHQRFRSGLTIVCCYTCTYTSIVSVLSWGPIFSAIAAVGNFCIIGGQHVFCAARRLASEREKKNSEPLRWQLEFECMVLKWDTPLRQRRRLAGHQQTAQLSGTGACMSVRVVLLMETLEEHEYADLSLTDVCRQMLEEAGLIADEGSLVCDCCSDAHYCPGP